MSRLLDWLIGRTPSDDSPAPPPPTTSTRPNPPTPNPAEPDDVVEILPDGGKLTLDEICTTIDYTDAKGRTTRRRITMLSLADGAASPILSAICHERRAFRQFRLDRIECFIDEDGEVIEPDKFFADNLGIRLPKQDARRTRHSSSEIVPPDGWLVTGEPIPPIQQLRSRIRPALSLLVAASRSDGMRDVEIDAIMAYVEVEAFGDSPYGRFTGITFDDIATLEPVIRKMRPRRASIPAYLRDLEALGEPHISRFNRALRHVIDADGRISPEEMGFLLQIEECRSDSESSGPRIMDANRIAKWLAGRELDPDQPGAGLRFCLSGQFSRFSRADCRSLVERIGGEITGRVDESTDVLVVGDDAGQRVAQAWKLADAGHGILIIGEHDFIDIFRIDE